MVKNILINLLKTNIYKISFTKKNGDQRVMICTLRDDLADLSNTPTAKGNKNEELLHVFDLEKKGWRCFYTSSVLSYSVALRNEIPEAYLTPAFPIESIFNPEIDTTVDDWF